MNSSIGFEDAIMKTPNAKRFRNDETMMSTYSKGAYDTTFNSSTSS